MLADELTKNDYVSKYGDFSLVDEENNDFCMTDEVEAVVNLANSDEETLESVQDIEQFISDFMEKAAKAGWCLNPILEDLLRDIISEK